MGWAAFWAIFFSNSSGHPAVVTNAISIDIWGSILIKPHLQFNQFSWRKGFRNFKPFARPL
jgi:hypothetical protein